MIDGIATISFLRGNRASQTPEQARTIHDEPKQDSSIALAALGESFLDRQNRRWRSLGQVVPSSLDPCACRPSLSFSSVRERLPAQGLANT